MALPMKEFNQMIPADTQAPADVEVAVGAVAAGKRRLSG